MICAFGRATAAADKYMGPSARKQRGPQDDKVGEGGDIAEGHAAFRIVS